jgi:hypothetical protein
MSEHTLQSAMSEHTLQSASSAADRRRRWRKLSLDLFRRSCRSKVDQFFGKSIDGEQELPKSGLTWVLFFINAEELQHLINLFKTYKIKLSHLSYCQFHLTVP